MMYRTSSCFFFCARKTSDFLGPLSPQYKTTYSKWHLGWWCNFKTPENYESIGINIAVAHVQDLFGVSPHVESHLLKSFHSGPEIRSHLHVAQEKLEANLAICLSGIHWILVVNNLYIHSKSLRALVSLPCEANVRMLGSTLHGRNRVLPILSRCKDRFAEDQ